MEIVLTSIVLVIVGLGIGILSGLLGIGGGTLMIPVFRLGYGLSAFMATATSLFAIIPISIAGMLAHIRAKTSIPKLGLIMGISGAVMSPVGVRLNAISPAWLIMVAAAIIIVYSAIIMLGKAIKMGRKSEKTTGADIQQQAPVPERARFEATARNVSCAVITGLIAGFASGYVGVGGGFIMVPLMTVWLRIPMKLTSGTSLLAIIILAIPGVIQQAFFGNIDYLAGILICIGAIPGAVVGARLVPRVPERTLRFIFAALLGVAAILLVVNEFVIS